MELVQRCQALLAAQDPYTASHSVRTGFIARTLGVVLRISGEELRALEIGAQLHDVGKSRVPRDILFKPGPLDEREWTILRRHPEAGAEMLDFLFSELPLVREIVLCHHERWDGGGYPRGLKGEAIPLLARIVAVADAYEAMTSDRPYRRALSPERAEEIIRQETGKQFDPQVAQALLDILAERPFWRTWRSFAEAMSARTI